MAGRAKVIIGDSRSMAEVGDGAIDLVVTSPPYWHIKDYGARGQIGYGQRLHEYLTDLYRVWTECFRVLGTGARLCINIGDQFARAAEYGRYRVIPLHAEIIAQCEKIGFDFMGSIIWQKKTTMNTSGGATVMGSFPYPPNGIVEIDYEYIHIMKKPGRSRRAPKRTKEASKLTKEEWKEYFRGHWAFKGARKGGHEAAFPEELPRRLVKMFSFVGETVLDPFAGSGTTIRAALALGRNAIGYEIREEFITSAGSRAASGAGRHGGLAHAEMIRRPSPVSCAEVAYVPGIKDIEPVRHAGSGAAAKDNLHKVTGVVDARTLELDGDLKVEFLGVEIEDEAAALAYLKKYVLGKEVFLRFDDGVKPGVGASSAYVYLKNRIFVNSYLIRSGLGSPQLSAGHRLAAKFKALKTGARS
jgi:DNA modification methylase